MYSQLEFNPFMWFFIPLIVIYIAMPFFSIMMVAMGKSLQKWFIGMAFFFVCVLPYILPEENVLFKELFPLASGFLVLTAAGYYFGKYDMNRRHRNVLYMLGFISVFTLGICYLGKGWLHTLFTYKAFPCVISSIAVFVMFKHIDWQKKIDKLRWLDNTRIAKISSYSLGIYLIQALFFDIYRSVLPQGMNTLLKFIIM